MIDGSESAIVCWVLDVRVREILKGAVRSSNAIYNSLLNNGKLVQSLYLIPFSTDNYFCITEAISDGILKLTRARNCIAFNLFPAGLDEWLSL